MSGQMFEMVVTATAVVTDVDGNVLNTTTEEGDN